MFDLAYLAYLDPSTGSTLFQLAVAGVLSVLATVRLYWKRIRSFVSRRQGGHRV